MASTLFELAAQTGAALEGDGATLVTRVATLDAAEPGTITFVVARKHRDRLAQTRASAAILAPELAGYTALPKLVSRNPYATYAKVAAILHPSPVPAPGIHASAVVSATARVPASATIGANAVLGNDVAIGERACIGAGTVLGDDVTIGEDACCTPTSLCMHGASWARARSCIPGR